MNKLSKIFVVLALCLMSAGLTFVLTVSQMEQFWRKDDTSTAPQVEQKLEEVYDVLEDYYIGELDPQMVADSASAGMVAGIGDEWSYYISASDYGAHLERINNAYVGIGVTVVYDETLERFKISEVTPNGPAQEAGLLPGDVVQTVDGVDCDGLELTELRDMVRGEAGTSLTLTVLREEEEISVTMERRDIETVVVTSQLLEDKIGYIKIYNFDSGCAEKTKAAIESLRNQGAESILFDVRNNPGGLKDELVELLDDLLPEGDLFRSVDYAGRESVDRSDADYLDMPMAVLVNLDSYSAAEFFAAALQEYEAAQVVGVQTYGKGRFQTAIQLSDGSAINLSIGSYYTPKGVSLTGVGITPDIVVELDDEDQQALVLNQLDYDDDEQLQAALDCLKR